MMRNRRVVTERRKTTTTIKRELFLIAAQIMRTIMTRTIVLKMAMQMHLLVIEMSSKMHPLHKLSMKEHIVHCHLTLIKLYNTTNYIPNGICLPA